MEGIKKVEDKKYINYVAKYIDENDYSISNSIPESKIVKNRNILKYRNNNVIGSTNMSTILNYIVFCYESIKKILASNKGTKNFRFSFTNSKLQKLFTIAILEYMDCLLCFADNNNLSNLDSEIYKQFCRDYLPIKDFSCFFNKECGFGVDYNNYGSLSLFPFVIKDVHDDQSISVVEKLNSCADDDYIKDFTTEDVLNKIFKYEVGAYSYYFMSINDLLKRVVAETCIRFVLYDPDVLGNVLNALKDDNLIINDNGTIEFSNLFEQTEKLLNARDVPNDENTKGERRLFNYLTCVNV